MCCLSVQAFTTVYYYSMYRSEVINQHGIKLYAVRLSIYVMYRSTSCPDKEVNYTALTETRGRSQNNRQHSDLCIILITNLLATVPGVIHVCLESA